MPFQLGDIILVGVMALSGLLALMRGFTREVLSLIAWGVAALAVLFAIKTPEIMALADQYIDNKTLAMIAVGAAVFLVALIIMSVISVKVADLVLDSAAGPFDRTLGFAYGLARGLLLVVVLYLFYIWLIPREKHEDFIRRARALPVVESVSQFMISFFPDDIAETLQGKTYLGTREGNPPASKPAAPKGDADTEEEEGYKPGDNRLIDKLIEGTQGGTSN